jgi:hypothetical protein
MEVARSSSLNTTRCHDPDDFGFKIFLLDRPAEYYMFFENNSYEYNCNAKEQNIISELMNHSFALVVTSVKLITLNFNVNN